MWGQIRDERIDGGIGEENRTEPQGNQDQINLEFIVERNPEEEKRCEEHSEADEIDARGAQMGLFFPEEIRKKTAEEDRD